MSDDTPCLRYTTDAFAKDIEVTGPIALYLQSSLSAGEANWLAAIYDLHTDGSTTPASKG
tara:strand:- start:11 stop:190 length:180 start_codon:yes stop_codon:yes gene_type:complete